MENVLFFFPQLNIKDIYIFATTWNSNGGYYWAKQHGYSQYRMVTYNKEIVENIYSEPTESPLIKSLTEKILNEKTMKWEDPPSKYAEAELWLSLLGGSL